MRSHPGSAANWPPAPGSPGLRRLPSASVDTVPDRVKERKRGRARKCLVQKAALTPTRTSSLRWKRFPCGFQEAGHSSLNPGVELPSTDEAGAPRISLLKIRHKAPLSTAGLQSPVQPVLRSKLLAGTEPQQQARASQQLDVIRAFTLDRHQPPCALYPDLAYRPLLCA